MVKELDTVVLASNLPSYGLEKWDVGTVVLIHEEGKGYEVEFVTLGGETVAVVSVGPIRYVRLLKGELPHVRAVA